MSDRAAWERLTPKSDREWHQVRVLCSYSLLVVLVLAVSFFVRHRQRIEIEQTWESATAVIEDVRMKPNALVNTQGDGAMLYEVAILARYRVGDSIEERWITVQQLPKLLVDAQFEAFRWKGKQCVVRWKRSNPGYVIAEVS